VYNMSEEELRQEVIKLRKQIHAVPPLANPS
jgi:hypothetical protein